MASANLVIIQLLHTKTNQAEFLRLCWDKLSQQQKAEIFHFLYLSDQHKTFLSALRTELSLDEPFIPWSYLFAILLRIKKLTPEILNSLISAQTSSQEMTRFRVNMPQLIELWIKHKEKIIENYKNKKKELLDSLDFARQQGFKEQRAKILDELKKFYPSDKDVDLAFHSEREYVARNTINRVVQKKLSQNDWYSGINDVDTKTANHLFKKVKAYTKKNGTALLSDFMIMFYHLEMHSEAMKVFDLATEKSPSLLWHALQIAIDGKQFASALSMIDLLRREYLNSENSFSLLYYQALALFGLGKKSEAKQIIANIVKIRPDFRSADTLLLEWDNEK